MVVYLVVRTSWLSKHFSLIALFHLLFVIKFLSDFISKILKSIIKFNPLPNIPERRTPAQTSSLLVLLSAKKYWFQIAFFTVSFCFGRISLHLVYLESLFNISGQILVKICFMRLPLYFVSSAGLLWDQLLTSNFG